MKKYTVTQTYEMTVSILVSAPDDWTPEMVQEQCADPDISVTVEPLFDWTTWDDGMTMEEGLCLDGVVSVNLPHVEEL